MGLRLVTVAGGATYAGIATGKGTSRDETKVTGFQVGAGGDVIDFGADTGTGHGSVWGQGGNNGLAGGDAQGLVNGGRTTLLVSFGGTNAVFQQVNWAMRSLLPRTWFSLRVKRLPTPQRSQPRWRMTPTTSTSAQTSPTTTLAI